MIGRYEVVQELGRGGMATVVLARDPRVGREVAIKLLPREFLHDPQFRARFEREAESAAALEHPAIVPVHDFGEHDGQPYLVMRYMIGGSLAERLRAGALSMENASLVLNPIASALDYAHSLGLVHRDLKPGNILFDQLGNAYLSDFGIVSLSDASETLTKSGIFIGTPAYMSPEQVQGDVQLDGRSDIYSLGIILFEILTGEQPYQADTPAKVMMKQVLDPVPHVRDVDPNLFLDADEVVMTAMAKSREDRFASAGEVAAALAGTTEAASTIPLAAPLPPPDSDGYAQAKGTAAAGIPLWGWMLGALAGLALATGLLGGGLLAFAPRSETPTLVPTQIAMPSPTTSASPTVSPSPTHMPARPIPTVAPLFAQVVSDANCRMGPGRNYNVIEFVSAGTVVHIYGRNLEGTWLWAAPLGAETLCWIFSPLVSLAGDPNSPPVLTPGPTNTASPPGTEPTPEPPPAPAPTTDVPKPTETPRPPQPPTPTPRPDETLVTPE